MKITCVEKIDMEAMKLILANFDLLWDSGRISHRDECYNKITNKEVARTSLTKFYSRHDITTGEALTEYKPSKNNPDGRIYAPYSLQTICRPIRHTISNDLIDIDIQNCHPVLLKELFDKHGIACPTLTEYVNEREAVLNVIFKKFKLEREDAKEKILAIMNGHSVDATDDEWFHNLKREVETLARRTGILFPDIYQRARRVSGENTHFKALNYVVCREERLKLDKIIAYCKKENLKIAAYCHDGLMLYRDPTRDYNQVCRILSDICGATLVVKRFDEALDLSLFPRKEIPDVEPVDDVHYEEDAELNSLPTYFDLKKKMERTFFKTLHPFRFVEERNGKLYTQKHKEFENAYLNLYCSFMYRGIPTKRSFPSLWQADPTIRTFHHYEFQPNLNKCEDDVYNQFKGFNADLMGGNAELGQEGLKVYLELRSLVVNHDPKSIEYLDKLRAWAIQKPEQKTGVAVVYSSMYGSGKGTDAEYWGMVMIGKEYCVETSSIKDIVTDSFNDAGNNKLFIIFDESKAEEVPEDKMKNFITGRYQTCRQKYQDTRTNVENFANMIFLSNGKKPVPIHQHERRHVVFRGDERYADGSTLTTKEEKKAFWTKIHSVLNTDKPCPHTAKAIIEYYRKIDLEGFHPQFDRVLTDAYNSVKASSMPAELRFIRDYTDDIISHMKNPKADHPFYLKSKELYMAYKDWHQSCNPQGKLIGKTTIEERWGDLPFLHKKKSAKEGNTLYINWTLKDLNDYWTTNGYMTQNVENIDDVAHTRLLAQQPKS